MLADSRPGIDGAPVALGGPKQRALVAILLLHANDVVPLDVLIDELWEGHAEAVGAGIRPELRLADPEAARPRHARDARPRIPAVRRA